MSAPGGSGGGMSMASPTIAYLAVTGTVSGTFAVSRSDFYKRVRFETTFDDSFGKTTKRG